MTGVIRADDLADFEASLNKLEAQQSTVQRLIRANHAILQESGSQAGELTATAAANAQSKAAVTEINAARRNFFSLSAQAQNTTEHDVRAEFVKAERSTSTPILAPDPVAPGQEAQPTPPNADARFAARGLASHPQAVVSCTRDWLIGYLSETQIGSGSSSYVPKLSIRVQQPATADRYSKALRDAIAQFGQLYSISAEAIACVWSDPDNLPPPGHFGPASLHVLGSHEMLRAAFDFAVPENERETALFLYFNREHAWCVYAASQPPVSKVPMYRRLTPTVKVTIFEITTGIADVLVAAGAFTDDESFLKAINKGRKKLEGSYTASEIDDLIGREVTKDLQPHLSALKAVRKIYIDGDCAWAISVLATPTERTMNTNDVAPFLERGRTGSPYFRGPFPEGSASHSNNAVGLVEANAAFPNNPELLSGTLLLATILSDADLVRSIRANPLPVPMIVARHAVPIACLTKL